MAEIGPRPSLRLPAPPPAKRRRSLSGCIEVAAVFPASETAAEGANAHVEDIGAEPEAPEALLNDTMVALLLLKSRFPTAEAKVVPFATRAQLYSLLSDRTTADRQLEELRRSNAVRLLQLPFAGRGDDQAIMLTEDYVAALRRCRDALLQQQQGKAQAGGGTATGGSGGGSSPPAVAVFGWFASRVLPACTEVMITHNELLALLSAAGARGKPGAGRPAAPAPSRPTGPAASTASGSSVTDAHVSLLLNQGFLIRHTASADSYLFSMPNAGAAVRSVAAGRQEVLSLLQRRRHPELLESELDKRKLQRSVLGVRWHVADMVGSGVLLRSQTTVGALLRVAKRGG